MNNTGAYNLQGGVHKHFDGVLNFNTVSDV